MTKLTRLQSVLFMGLEVIDSQLGRGNQLREMTDYRPTKDEMLQHFRNVYPEWNGEEGEDWSPLLAAVEAWLGNEEVHAEAEKAVRLATAALGDEILAEMSQGFSQDNSNMRELRLLSIAAVADYALPLFAPIQKVGEQAWNWKVAESLCEDGLWQDY